MHDQLTPQRDHNVHTVRVEVRQLATLQEGSSYACQYVRASLSRLRL